MTELSIIPECYVDTKVAEILGQAQRYNHQHSSGAVATQLQNSFKDRMALGIVDEDRKKKSMPKYFSEFRTLRTENNLILKKHKARKQYLILICPEIEKWLLTDAKAANIDPTISDFALPADLIGLQEITKSYTIDKNIGFHRFIKALIRANAPSITTLKSWIELFKKDELDTLINQ